MRAPEAALLLCPGGPPRPDFWRGLFDALRAKGPTAYMLSSAGDWRQGAPPGPDTFFTPRFPFLMDRAIASARAVVSGNPERLAAARAAGVPAIEVAPGDEMPQAIADRIELALGHERAKRRAAARRGRDLRFVCVADREYVPFLFGLLENLREVHPGGREVFLLALDDETAGEAARFCTEERLAIVRPRDLWSDAEWRRIAPRGRAVQAYSSKPRLLKRAIGREPVFYFDLDLYFFRSPIHLARELARASVLLFPHLNRDLPSARLHGLYNAGMIGVAKGAEPFLDWWADLCLYECKKATSEGFYDDQGFLDLAPIYFEDVKTYRGHDEDVAHWNFATLGVTTPPDRPWEPRLATGKPVGSLHAAQPDDLGLFELKSGWDQLVAIHSGARPTESFALNVLLAQKFHHRRLKTLFSAHHTLNGRLGIRPLPMSSRGARFFVDGKGRRLLDAAAVVYRAGRGAKRLLRPPASASPHPAAFSWVKLSQRALFRHD